MNKLELIQKLKEETGISRTEATNIMQIFLEQVSDTLEDDGRVEIRGFCSFFVKKYKRYMGRNPKSGKTVLIEPKKLPFFKLGKELRERINR